MDGIDEGPGSTWRDAEEEEAIAAAAESERCVLWSEFGEVVAIHAGTAVAVAIAGIPVTHGLVAIARGHVAIASGHVAVATAGIAVTAIAVATIRGGTRR